MVNRLIIAAAGSGKNYIFGQTSDATIGQCINNNIHYC